MWWEALLDVQEPLPVVWVWSGDPPGYPGAPTGYPVVVGCLSRLSGSGWEAHPDDREWSLALTNAREWLRVPPGCSGVVKMPCRMSGSSVTPFRMSGSGGRPSWMSGSPSRLSGCGRETLLDVWKHLPDVW